MYTPETHNPSKKTTFLCIWSTDEERTCERENRVGDVLHTWSSKDSVLLASQHLFHVYLNIIPLAASHTMTLFIFPDNTDVLTFCYFLLSIPFNRKNCALNTVQCKTTHWFSNKQCPSKFAAVFLKFWMLLQTAMKMASQIFLAPSGVSVQIIQLLNGREAAAFPMSSGYLCLSAPIVEWTATNNTARWVWCVKLDDINNVLTT